MEQCAATELDTSMCTEPGVLLHVRNTPGVIMRKVKEHNSTHEVCSCMWRCIHVLVNAQIISG